ncbi:MAG: metallophosphoesterase [Candidatus Sumerlaeaceae bacterium]|nr:metallophosphoesterase [Candidatus Sumerlaeaceae bacterium]
MSGRTWLAAGLAVLIVAGTYAVDTVFVPMHADGHAQGVLGHVNALAFLLSVPGCGVARVVAGGFDNRFSPEYHVTASVTNGVFYFWVLRLALGAAAWARGGGVGRRARVGVAVRADSTAKTTLSSITNKRPSVPGQADLTAKAALAASASKRASVSDLTDSTAETTLSSITSKQPSVADHADLTAGVASTSTADPALLPGAEPASPAMSRRGFLLASARAGVGVALAGGVSGVAWALFVQPRRYEIVRHRLALPDLPRELDGLRVVQLSDIHHGPWLSLDYLSRVVADTNALEPDLVLLTGDYVQGRRHYVASCVAALAALAPRIGVLAVLGNHDWWEGVEEARRAFAREGIPLIDNDRRVLTPDRRLMRPEQAGGWGARGLAIAGIGDYLEGEPDFAAALNGLPSRMPCLLLSHWPDAAEDPAMRRGRWRVDLMLCGHTHGGQIRLPLVGAPLVPSRYGQKYAAGFVDGPACRVYVNRGIGTALLPVRWGVPPEITVFDLACDSENPDQRPT